MKILITGIGITGKSTLRRLLASKLQKKFAVKHYDADQRHGNFDVKDYNYLKDFPEFFSENVIYIVEDVHATLPQTIIQLDNYDLILYVQPDFLSHLMFWFSRCRRWFIAGNFSWEAHKGWRGTGIPYDFKNIIPILEIMLNDFWKRKKWIKEDLRIISRVHPFIIHSRWTRQGPRFILSLKK